LWELFEFGTAYFGLQALRRVVGALLVAGMGGFVVRKKTVFASAMKAGNDVLYQHRIWFWQTSPTNIRSLELIVQLIGYTFVLFGILVALGILPESGHYTIIKKRFTF